MVLAVKNELEFQHRWVQSTRLNGCVTPFLQVVSPGVLNRDAGPDFTNATVRMDGLLWHGNIELHLNANDWYLHQHHLDPAYNNVILHVVLEGEAPVQTQSGAWVPTIKMSHEAFLTQSLPQKSPTLGSLLLLAQQRLGRYTEMYQLLLQRSSFNSFQAFCTWLAMAFGRPQNDLPFEQLCKRIHFEGFVRYNQHERAVLLSYYSGLFPQNAFSSSDVAWVKRVGDRLGFVQVNRHHWKRSRMRPVNQPTNRLMQFNQLLSFHNELFSLFSGSCLIANSANDFVQLCSSFSKGIGITFINKLLLNAWLPALVCEQQRKGNRLALQQATQYITHMSPEDNHLIRAFSASHQLKLNHAGHSQGALEYLYLHSYMN